MNDRMNDRERLLNIDQETVWTTVDRDILELKRNVENILNEMDG